jgi:hypothetical protein
MGTVRTFENDEMTDDQGFSVIEASAAIPGIFQPVVIADVPYVDGGVLNNTPLRPAIRDGADVLHVIYLDPDVGSIPIHHLSNLLSVQYRVQIINWAERINRSIDFVSKVNDAIRVREALKDKTPEQAEAVRQVTSLLVNNPEEAKELTIHRYHPHDPLGGALGLLDFRRGRILDLIDRGFADAISHDCDRSQCVIPGKPKRMPDECKQFMQLGALTANGQAGARQGRG